MRLSGHILCLFGCALLATVPARASFIYDFVFTPTVTLAGNSIQSFSFTATSSDFITAPSALSFTPFEITNGVTSTWIDAGESSLVGQNGCFVFVAFAPQILPGCGFNATPGAGLLTLNSPLPSLTGQYAFSSVWALVSGDPFSAVGANGMTVGTTEVTISASTGGGSSNAPEPVTFFLFSTGLGLLLVVPARHHVTSK